MVASSLKKLVLRKELSLIKEVISAIDSSLSIYDANDNLLLGSANNHGMHNYPVRLEGEIIGWVTGSEKANIVASLLSHLANKELEKKTLAREVLSKYKEITLLFNISEQIIASIDVKEVAKLVLDEAKRLLKSVSGSVMLLHENTDFLENLATFGNDFDCQTTIRLGKGILGNVIQLGRGEIINDVAYNPTRSMLQQTKVNSLICVPLKNQDQVIGAIALSRLQSLPYTAEDLKLLTTLASQAAGAINALLHEQKLKESRQNALLFRLSCQIRDSLELDAILNTAVSEIRRMLQLDRCFFLWYKPQEDRNVNTNKENLGSTTHKICRVVQPQGGLQVVHEAKNPAMDSLLGYYATQEVESLVKRMFCQDIFQVDDVRTLANNTTRQFLLTKGFTSLLAVPIETHSGRLGVIGCGTNHQTRTWSSDDINMLQAVANQLAIAIDQAELYQHSRNTARIAEEKAQQLEITLQQLQQTQVQLVQSAKMSSLGQMAAGIAHEINNPVNFIHGNVDHIKEYTEDLLGLVRLYQQDYPEPTVKIETESERIDVDFLLEDFPKILKSIQVGSDRIRDIVLSMRNFSRLDEAEKKPVDIHEGIESTLLILHNRLKPKPNFTGIEVIREYAQLPKIECYAGQLNQVFMNLLSNAVDALEESYANKNEQQTIKPQIRICTKLLADNQISISIADNGSGISTHVQEQMFDPFFTTKSVGKGTGLGLSISYQIVVDKHKGTIDCISSPNQGTEFKIAIPITTN